MWVSWGGSTVWARGGGWGRFGGAGEGWGFKFQLFQDIWVKTTQKDHGREDISRQTGRWNSEYDHGAIWSICQAGDTCRYAHGVKELRGAQMGMP